MLAASRYTRINAQFIPLDVVDVAGTPFDFRRPTRIDARIRQADPQLALAKGYDHKGVLDPHPPAPPRAGGGLHEHLGVSVWRHQSLTKVQHANPLTIATPAAGSFAFN